MVKKEETVVFRVQKGKNFVGFTHPETRKFVTANKNGEFVISVDDSKALDVLKNATDVFEV